MQIRPYQSQGPTCALDAKPSRILTTGTAHSFLLTLTNPLYDPIRLTLSTPAKSPGLYTHSTTILRPEFTVGANADIWNDDEETISPAEKEKRHSRFGIYEAKRNIITIFMEVVPAIPQGTTENQDDVAQNEVAVDIPIFIKMIYQIEDTEKDDTLTLASKGLEVDKEKGKVEKELGYWAVVRVGYVRA